VHTVREALELGYRHVDTAEYYDNQAEVGDAIAQSAVDREAVFLTTKVWRTNLRHNEVLAAANESLDALGLEYVDLLLVHWPSRSVPIGETMEAMNHLQKEGKVRFVGVSNFSVSQVAGAMGASATPILTNQVEYHPFERRDDLLAFCIENDVMLTAYSPLAKGRVADDATLAEIGDRYGKTAAQVSLRWLLQQEMVAAIPKAASRDHLRENGDVFDFELTDAEMERIFEVGGDPDARLRDLLGF